MVNKNKSINEKQNNQSKENENIKILPTLTDNEKLQIKNYEQDLLKLEKLNRDYKEFSIKVQDLKKKTHELMKELNLK